MVMYLLSLIKAIVIVRKGGCKTKYSREANIKMEIVHRDCLSEMIIIEMCYYNSEQRTIK